MSYSQIRIPVANDLEGASGIVAAVMRFASDIYIATGEGPAEVWLSQRAYDSLTLLVLEQRNRRLETDEERKKQEHLYRNGKLVIVSPAGPVTVRLK